MTNKRITLRSPEIQALGRELAKQGEQRRGEQDKINASRGKLYWPSEKDYFLWSHGGDYSEFYAGIEEFLQMVYDLKSPDQMPQRPRLADTRKRRYLYFNLLSRFYNSGELRIQFINIP